AILIVRKEEYNCHNQCNVNDTAPKIDRKIKIPNRKHLYCMIIVYRGIIKAIILHIMKNKVGKHVIANCRLTFKGSRIMDIDPITMGSLYENSERTFLNNLLQFVVMNAKNMALFREMSNIYNDNDFQEIRHGFGMKLEGSCIGEMATFLFCEDMYGRISGWLGIVTSALKYRAFVVQVYVPRKNIFRGINQRTIL
ncbi:hypothetical protein L9F63_023783, partial [Diploptera punctata]